MENNYLFEGEPLSKETCFKHLYITFKLHLATDPDKNEKFRLLTEYMINENIVGAVKNSKGKVVFFYNKNLITKREFYCLLANVYVRFFGTSLAMKMYVSIGCALFDHDIKELRSIYVTMRRYRYKEPPELYTKYF
jgi:hypothetical protein